MNSQGPVSVLSNAPTHLPQHQHWVAEDPLLAPTSNKVESEGVGSLPLSWESQAIWDTLPPLPLPLPVHPCPAFLPVTGVQLSVSLSPQHREGLPQLPHKYSWLLWCHLSPFPGERDTFENY